MLSTRYIILAICLFLLILIPLIGWIYNNYFYKHPTYTLTTTNEYFQLAYDSNTYPTRTFITNGRGDGIFYEQPVANPACPLAIVVLSTKANDYDTYLYSLAPNSQIPKPSTAYIGVVVQYAVPTGRLPKSSDILPDITTSSNNTTGWLGYVNMTHMFRQAATIPEFLSQTKFNMWDIGVASPKILPTVNKQTVSSTFLTQPSIAAWPIPLNGQPLAKMCSLVKCGYTLTSTTIGSSTF